MKQLLKLQLRHQVQIRDAVSKLESMPDVTHVKSLAGHSCGYRLRVGDCRVLFDWDGGVKIVSVQEVKKRDERTYS